MKKPANRCSPKFQYKRFRISRLAGFLPFIWPNLCTRYILNRLTPRGHEDWPDKRRSVRRSGTRHGAIPIDVAKKRALLPRRAVAICWAWSVVQNRIALRAGPATGFVQEGIPASCAQPVQSRRARSFWSQPIGMAMPRQKIQPHQPTPAHHPPRPQKRKS